MRWVYISSISHTFQINLIKEYQRNLSYKQNNSERESLALSFKTNKETDINSQISVKGKYRIRVWVK